MAARALVPDHDDPSRRAHPDRLRGRRRPNGPYTPFRVTSDTLPEINEPEDEQRHLASVRGPAHAVVPVHVHDPRTGGSGRRRARSHDPHPRPSDGGGWSTLPNPSPIDGHSAVMFRAREDPQVGHGGPRPSSLRCVPITNPRRGARPQPDRPELERCGVDEGGADLPHAHGATRRRRAGDGRAEHHPAPTRCGRAPCSSLEIWHPGTNTWTKMAGERPASRLPQHVVAAARWPGAAGRQRRARRVDDGQRGRAPRSSRRRTCTRGRGLVIPGPADDDGLRQDHHPRDAGRRADRQGEPRAHGLRHAQLQHGPALAGSSRSERNDGQLEIDAPASPNTAPPGVYYLFIIDDNGVPSKAAILSISNSADTQAPSVPSGVSTSGGVGRVSLSWTASSDNVGVARYVVHRSSSPGFTPSAATRVATPTGTSLRR